MRPAWRPSASGSFAGSGADPGVPAPGPKLGEGREAEIFAWDDGLVLRLLRPAMEPGRADLEAAAMSAAADAGAPVPAVIDRVEVDGRFGLVMERVDGLDQLSLLARRPWRALSEARALGALHAELHDVRAPESLLDLAEAAGERIEAAPMPDDLRDRALAILAELPRGDALCDGDFHPANVLLGRDGPKVIDWVAAARGDAHADVARTTMLLTVSPLPPGAPATVRALDRVGRRLLLRGYLRSYARARRLDRGLLTRWEAVRAGDRFHEGIEGEEERLLAFMRARLDAV